MTKKRIVTVPADNGPSPFPSGTGPVEVSGGVLIDPARPLATVLADLLDADDTLLGRAGSTVQKRTAAQARALLAALGANDYSLASAAAGGWTEEPGAGSIVIAGGTMTLAVSDGVLADGTPGNETPEAWVASPTGGVRAVECRLVSLSGDANSWGGWIFRPAAGPYLYWTAQWQASSGNLRLSEDSGGGWGEWVTTVGWLAGDWLRIDFDRGQWSVSRARTGANRPMPQDWTLVTEGGVPTPSNARAWTRAGLYLWQGPAATPGPQFVFSSVRIETVG